MNIISRYETDAKRRDASDVEHVAWKDKVKIKVKVKVTLEQATKA
jgi:hypothetical protein